MNRQPRRVEHLDFGTNGITAVVERMVHIDDAGDGWINCVPETPDNETSTQVGFLKLFGGGSIGITMCTWMPNQKAKNGNTHTSVGVAHTIGKRLTTALRPLTIPETWRIEQDHPRRGFVLQIPSNESHEQVLTWMLQLLEKLSPIGTIGKWRAEIHLPKVS